MLRRIGTWFRFALLATLVCVLLLFVVNNHGAISISLFPLPYTADMPLFVLTVLFFCAGLLMGGTMMSLKMLRLKRLLATFRTRAMALENELKSKELAASSLPPVK